MLSDDVDRTWEKSDEGGNSWKSNHLKETPKMEIDCHCLDKMTS